MIMHIMGSRQLFTKENFEKLIGSSAFSAKALTAAGGYYTKFDIETEVYEVEQLDVYAASGPVDLPEDRELILWAVPVISEDLKPSVHRAIMENDHMRPVSWPEAACHIDGSELLVLLYERHRGERPCA